MADSSLPKLIVSSLTLWGGGGQFSHTSSEAEEIIAICSSFALIDFFSRYNPLILHVDFKLRH